MTGCYGNSQEDRHFAKMLDNYLDELEKYEPYSIHKLVISGDFQRMLDFEGEIYRIFEDREDTVIGSYSGDDIFIDVECWTEFAFELLEETVLELVEQFAGEICVEWE